MTLYNFLKENENDYDTYDNVYDICVTVSYIKEEHDYYDMFCKRLYQKVNVLDIINGNLIVDWSELIKRNMSKFIKFMKSNWKNQFDYINDVDEFIYQWIKEIGLYISGYVSDSFYEVLYNFVNDLCGVEWEE